MARYSALQDVAKKDLRVRIALEAEETASGDGFALLAARLEKSRLVVQRSTQEVTRVRQLVVFESLTYSRPQREAVIDRVQKSPVSSFGFTLDGRAGEVYNEETFRHFLDVERTRAERCERSFFLLLVSLRKCPTQGSHVPRAVSSSLLSGLSLCVREVDFIGWYRDERVAGAVLAQGFDVPGSDAPSRIVERVIATLSLRLPSTVAERLRVRVVQLGPRAK